MSPDASLPLDLTETVDTIGSMIERVLTASSEAELLGPLSTRCAASTACRDAWW